MAKSGISVIIVSWNTRDITDQCLACMKKAVTFVKKDADVEVIVAENASEDGSAEMITKKHPWAKLYRTGSDLGYGKGNNYGFKKSNPKYEYVLLLNNDAYVREDTLKRSLDFMRTHPECDVLGCRLEYADGRFQPSAGSLPTPSSVWGWMWGLDKLPLIGGFFSPVHPHSREFFKTDREVGWTMGAFLFLKRKVFEKTNGFDENFFMYMEEVEWCRRVRQDGYQIWYTPGFSITHLDKASAMGNPVELSKIFRREIRGLVYFMRKHYSNAMFWILPVIKTGVAVRLLAFILTGNTMRQQAYAQLLKEI